MRILNINNAISFSRRPRPEEEERLKTAINEAYDAMGTTDRVVITHGSCFPAMGRDTHIGSPYGRASQEYIKFLELYGFNANQLGPGGELGFTHKGVIKSPYSSSAFAQNRLFIDLETLTTEEYGNILSKKTFNKVTNPIETTDKNYTQTNFEEALHTYNIALKEAFNNFKIKVRNGQPEALKLNREFEKFNYKYDEKLTQEGIFKVLSRQYGTDNFTEWDNEIDADLIRRINNSNPEALNRYYTLIRDNQFDIKLYKFEQFLINKQIKENKQWRDEQGFKYFNDLLVGCSKMDYWRYRDAFLDDYVLGAPHGGEDNKPQVWYLPALNPRKLFSSDGLGPSGQFIKDKIDYSLEFCENIRIDHVMGLIEPYLIDISFPNRDIKGQYMSEIYLSDGTKLDDYKNYSCDYVHSDGKKTFTSNVMDKIVIPTLKEHGINPEDVVWEDLCSQPEAFSKVFYDDLNLPGLTQTDWDKVENSPSQNWYLLGSHDSMPAQKMVEYDSIKSSGAWDPLYLAGYLNQDETRWQNRDGMCRKIGNNDRELVKAKFAELLTTQKFQISFADLLGIKDTVYNRAGTVNDTNWKERITPDFLDKYYENLSGENPTAINIPEVLKMALQAKIDMKVVESSNPDQTRTELYREYKPLLDELQKYADILKEPEN